MISAADVDFYDQKLDKSFPLGLAELVEELIKHENSYSQKDKHLIDEFKLSAMDVINRYFSLTQIYYDWCDLITFNYSKKMQKMQIYQITRLRTD